MASNSNFDNKMSPINSDFYKMAFVAVNSYKINPKISIFQFFAEKQFL